MIYIIIMLHCNAVPATLTTMKRLQIDTGNVLCESGHQSHDDTTTLNTCNTNTQHQTPMHRRITTIQPS